MISTPSAARDELSDVIEQFRPGWSLAQVFYNDPRVFAREMERIFMKEWLLIDHASRIPRPGDYFVFEIAGESIVVIRGKDQAIRAFFNVCPHRGSRICLEPAGSAQALVCPYHAWSFGLDGRLLGARSMPEDFKREDFGLRRCAVRVVEDLIFISLAEQPSEIEEAFQLWEKYLRLHGTKKAKIAHRITWRVKANWKITLENFAECYHCGPAHPEYCSVMQVQTRPITGTGRDAKTSQAFTQQWEEQAKAMGTFLERVTLPGDLHCMCTRVPIKEGFLTQSRDGQPIAPLMGSFKAYDGGVTSGELGLVNCFIATNDYCIIPRFTPMTAETSEMEIVWLVRADAVENVDYRMEDLIWLWKITTDQDKRIIEDNQAGVNSRIYRPGPLAEVERGVRRFASHYMRAIT